MPKTPSDTELINFHKEGFLSFHSLNRDIVRIAYWLCILASVLFLSSCINAKRSFPPSSGRFLLYIHSTTTSPPDVDFTISGIDLETDDGRIIKVVEDTINISSIALAAGQVLLKEAAVEPASYRAIKIRISRATINKKEGPVSLALPEPDGMLSVKANFTIRKNESYVCSLEWNSLRSIEDRYRFQPYIGVELQMPSPRGLLLFVSNRGSNYITIIDRSRERVIGAVTVGDGPSGMAINSLQDQLYVVNSGSRSISVIGTSQFRLLATIQLPGGMGPSDITFVPDQVASEGTQLSLDGKLYITNRISNDVTVVSTATSHMLGIVPVGNHPSHIAADLVRKEIYVTNERSNDLNIISVADDRVVGTIAVNRSPTGIAVGKDKLYIFNEGSNNISIVSPSSRKVVGTVTLAASPKRGMVGFGGRIFIADTSADRVTFLSQLDFITRELPVSRGPINITGDERRNRIYVTNSGDNSVSVIDPVGEKVSKKIFVGLNPFGVTLIDR